MDEQQRQNLRRDFGRRIRFDEPLRRHTSFRIGGPADVWVEVVDATEIRRVQAYAAATGLPLFVFGGGTNVLVSDRGVRGIVLHPGKGLASVEWRKNGRGEHVRAGAALSLKRLAAESMTRHLSGLEFADGIPGTLGGGLLMNAGAFGGEIADVLEAIEGIDTLGAPQRLLRSELHSGYRRLDLPRGFIVTHLELLLRDGDPAAIEARRSEARLKRRAHQPLGYPNAGSIFKNPPGQFAGRLIEQAGLKGLRQGGAMVSDQHANFIVNTGGATAADVHDLMEKVTRCVLDMHGVRLEPEIRLVGEWSAP